MVVAVLRDTDLPEPPREDIYPGGPRFLGVCIVEGPEVTGAVSRAWALGCNPGGQVVGIGPFDPDEAGFPPEIRDRLLTRDELAERDLIGTWEEHGLEADEDGYLHEKGCGKGGDDEPEERAGRGEGVRGDARAADAGEAAPGGAAPGE